MSKTVRKTIAYFSEKGKGNTEDVMRIVSERLREGGIEAVVVATTSGATALKAAQILPQGTRIIGVSFQPAYWKQHARPKRGIRRKAEELGVTFMPEEPTARYLKDISAHVPDTLRRMGQGMKVAVEVSMQAVEVGLIAPGARVISCGGSSKGADAAIVVQAASELSGVWISEILAKPL